MSENTNTFVTNFSSLFGTLTVYIDEYNGNPWFLAKDVANILDYKRSNGKVMASDMTRFLDDDEKDTRIVRTPGGEQTVTVISESGLYHAIFKSRKKEANEFRKWVTSIVLPSVRKNGGYIMGHENLSSEDRAELETEIKKLRDMVRNKQYRIDELIVARDVARHEARSAEDEAKYWQEEYQRNCWN